MSPVDTNKLLLKHPSGTFLFRFSSQVILLIRICNNLPITTIIIIYIAWFCSISYYLSLISLCLLIYFLYIYTQPGCYTLSVSNNGQVGHWRIKSEKGPDWGSFWIDERRYDSLQQVPTITLISYQRLSSSSSAYLIRFFFLDIDRSLKPI